MRGNNYRNNRRNDDDEDDDENEDEYRSNRRNRRKYDEDEEDEDRSKRREKKSNLHIIIFACMALFVCFCIYVYMTIPSEIREPASDAPRTTEPNPANTPTNTPTNTPRTTETKPTTFVDNTLTYDFIPLYDSPGGDTYQKFGSIDELKTICIADSNCKGFNSSGWMKNTIAPRTSWVKWTDDNNKGLYVKRKKFFLEN